VSACAQLLDLFLPCASLAICLYGYYTIRSSCFYINFSVGSSIFRAHFLDYSDNMSRTLAARVLPPT
jgi:hypothetical protein